MGHTTPEKISLTFYADIYSKFKGHHTANYAILSAVLLSGIVVLRPASLRFSLIFKD